MLVGRNAQEILQQMRAQAASDASDVGIQQSAVVSETFPGQS